MSLVELEHAAGLLQAAPAKINLALHVTGRRQDGYHSLETLVAFTALGDRVGVAPAVSDRFSTTGRFAAQVPDDGGNLVIRARNLIRALALEGERSARPRPLSSSSTARRDGTSAHPRPVAYLDKAEALAGGPVALSLAKSLPVASGLGGGSSDAAATLHALNALWMLGFSPSQLAAQAASLGADVPMCIHARPLVARGIGEAVEPLGGFPSLAVVLVNPGVPVSTPAVFKALSSRENPPLPFPGRMAAAREVCSWLAETRNDLEPPAQALAPSVARARAALLHAGAGFARMSGSGATCFGIFDRDGDAQAAAAALRRDSPFWWVEATRTLPSPTSPADDDC